METTKFLIFNFVAGILLVPTHILLSVCGDTDTESDTFISKVLATIKQGDFKNNFKNAFLPNNQWGPCNIQATICEMSGFKCLNLASYLKPPWNYPPWHLAHLWLRKRKIGKYIVKKWICIIGFQNSFAENWGQIRALGPGHQHNRRLLLTFIYEYAIFINYASNLFVYWESILIYWYLIHIIYVLIVVYSFICKTYK